MQKDLVPPLLEAIAALERHGYRYAVIGGVAASAWGQVRATRDVDLKVLVTDTDYESARDAIRSSFPERGRPDVPPNPLIVDAKVGEFIVDFLLTMPGYDQNVVTRAVRLDLGNLEAWICSPEDLIILKGVAARVQDWLDIEGVLIEQQDKLDYAYIEDWLQQFADLLEEPEITARYRQIRDHIARVRRQAEQGET